jgi:hypothetical protein
MDIHFVREKVAYGHVWVLHVPTSQQFADNMTKGLPTSTFSEFWSSLCVAPDPSAAEGCWDICICIGFLGSFLVHQDL